MEAFASPEWVGVEAGASLSPQAPYLDLRLIPESPFLILDMRQGSKLSRLHQTNGSFFSILSQTLFHYGLRIAGDTLK